MASPELLADMLSGALCAVALTWLRTGRRKKQHEEAIAEAERALALDPDDADGYETLGEILSFAGRPEETLGLVEKALRLNPRQPVSLLWLLGRAYSLTGRYEEAIATLKKVTIRNPNHLSAHNDLAIIYIDLDWEEEARAEVAEILRVNPRFSLKVAQDAPYRVVRSRKCR